MGAGGFEPPKAEPSDLQSEQPETEVLCGQDLRSCETEGAAQSAARDPEKPPTEADAGLAQLIQSWPHLPAPIKAGILAMVKASDRT